MRAPGLVGVRERWLSAATAALRDDPLVVGAALVGSLGAGTADDWSDVDLLVVVEDACLEDLATLDRLPSGLGRLAFGIDARHNGPVGTRAVSAQYVVDGRPGAIGLTTSPPYVNCSTSSRISAGPTALPPRMPTSISSRRPCAD